MWNWRSYYLQLCKSLIIHIMYFIVQKSAFSTTYTISFKHDISLGLTLQNLKTIWLYKCSPFELFSKKGSIKSHQCLLYLAHGRYRWKSLMKRQDKVSNPLIVWDTIIMFNDMDSINMFPSSADYVFFFHNFIYKTRLYNIITN